jgi:hypothetical protein
MSQDNVDALFRKFDGMQDPSQLDGIFQEAEQLDAGDKTAFAEKIQSEMGWPIIKLQADLKVEINTAIAEGFDTSFLKMIESMQFVSNDLVEKVSPVVKLYSLAASELEDEDCCTPLSFLLICASIQKQTAPKPPANPFKKPPAGPKA